MSSDLFSVPPPHERTETEEVLWQWYIKQRADLDREHAALFRKTKLAVGDRQQLALSRQWADSLVKIEQVAIALQAASKAGYLTILGSPRGLIIHHSLTFPPRKRNAQRRAGPPPV